MTERLERRDYMRNEGFVLVDDVGHQYFDDVFHTLEVERISPEPGNLSAMKEVRPSAGGVALLADNLSRQIRERRKPTDRYAGYRVTDADLAKKNNKFTFGEGFGDLDFTWHFAPGLANAVVMAFRDDGYISNEEYDAMTLGDWSDIIGSGWFSDLVHDMALTSNGTYQGFGRYGSNYRPNALRAHLDDRSGVPLAYGTRLFDVHSTYDDLTDLTFLTASTSSDFRSYLRKRMQESKSPGCPVARRAGTLSLELITSNPHARNLLTRDNLAITDTDNERGRARFTQDYTPIDRALDALAGMFDTYDARFGTPYWRPESYQIVHYGVPKTAVLMHQGDAPFVAP